MRIPKRVLKKFLFANFFFFIGFSSSVWATGPGFDKTRLIIEGGKQDGSLVLNNRGDGIFYVRAHVEDCNHKKTADAMAHPAVFQLNPQKASRIRVFVDKTKVSQSQETMFWLYTKAYPAKKIDNTTNLLSFNFISQLKVFYRPKGLKGDLSTSARKVQWFIKSDQVVAKNNSPYNISLAAYHLNGKLIDTNHVIAPYSEHPTGIKLSKLPVKFGWTIVNDFGGVETHTVDLK